jgi:hypothetical protein
MLPVRAVFRKLRAAASTDRVRFTAYHPRPSGNFLASCSAEQDFDEVAGIGKQVTGLRCIVRPLSALALADTFVPPDAETRRGSALVRRPEGPWRVVVVALNQDMPRALQTIGPLTSKISVIAWPTPRDALVLYLRHGEEGEYGQVREALVRALCQAGLSDVDGTARTLGVVRDLLSGNRLRRD